MNKEVEEAIIALSQIKKGYNKPVDFALPIIKQAFEDLEERLENRENTLTECGIKCFKLQSKIDEVEEICNRDFKSFGYGDLQLLIKKGILKEE